MNDKKTTFTIRDLAQEFALTPRSIRHYEEVNLLSPKREGSKRIYSKSDRVRLQLIMRGKRIGLSLSEIHEIITMYALPSGEKKQTQLLLKKIEERRSTLHQQMKDIAVMLDELNQLEQRLKPD
ncbi:MAG: MerR family DNA-binding transcriptional regulator [Gammaproteobacteria bacterium]|nr:MerR family DNA-binding transcriptional regulator [Gammaproteobacteria bacterium]